MEEVNDVAVDTQVVDEKVNDGKVDMTGAGADTAKGSSPEGTAGLDKSGKDVKTGAKEADSEANPDDEVVDDGNPIPYERFKKVNEQKNKFKADYENLSAENEGMAELLNNPIVFKAALQAKGITDPKILASKMKEAGFELDEKTDQTEDELFNEFSKGLDLNSPKDWFKMMKRMSEHYAQESVKPVMGKLSSKDVQEYLSTQEAEAKKVAKENFGLEYGISGKDEGNPNTAVGKMYAYLSKHPEDTKLGHVKILRLALSEEGVKLGEKKGEQKEKDRQKMLRSSAMEDDAQVVKEGQPDSTWSVPEIMAWRRKNGK
jgi:hypothetical protein